MLLTGYEEGGERNQEDGLLILNEQPNLENGGDRQVMAIVCRWSKRLPWRSQAAVLFKV